MVTKESVHIDFRVLAEKAGIGMAVLDGSFRFIYVNPRLSELLGFENDELTSLACMEISHPDDLDEIMHDLEQLKRGESREISLRKRFRCKNGDYLWTRYTVSHAGKMGDISDAYIGVVERSGFGSVPDSDFRQIFQNTPDMIFVTDREKMLIDFNSSFVKATGYGHSELTGKKLETLMADESRSVLNEVFSTIEKGEKYNDYTLRTIRKDGRSLHMLVTTVPQYKNGDFVSAWSIARDVTDKKRGQMEANRINKQLIEKNRELEQIVYVTSHDLRSPLVNIQGFTQELEISIQDLKKLLETMSIPEKYRNEIEYIVDTEIPESIDYINSGTYKMDQLLKGLLTISRLGRRPLEKVELDMNSVVKEIAKSLEFQLKEEGISLETDPLPPCIADESQILQVFSNLLDNAIKYMREDEKGKIRISGEKISSGVRYMVSDNGRGIPKDKHERVFEIFYRDEQGESGDGLGLTIVRKVIEKHMGEVSIESSLNQGTSVIITIPN